MKIFTYVGVKSIYIDQVMNIKILTQRVNDRFNAGHRGGSRNEAKKAAS